MSSDDLIQKITNLLPDTKKLDISLEGNTSDLYHMDPVHIDLAFGVERSKVKAALGRDTAPTNPSPNLNSTFYGPVDLDKALRTRNTDTPVLFCTTASLVVNQASQPPTLYSYHDVRVRVKLGGTEDYSDLNVWIADNLPPDRQELDSRVEKMKVMHEGFDICRRGWSRCPH